LSIYLVLAENRRKWDDSPSSEWIGYEQSFGMVLRISIDDRAVDGLCSASPPTVDADWREINFAVAALDLSPVANLRRTEVTKRRADKLLREGL
jgi:hypothetical protein